MQELNPHKELELNKLVNVFKFTISQNIKDDDPIIEEFIYKKIFEL